MTFPSPHSLQSRAAHPSARPAAQGASAYARTGMQTAAMAATPHQLITMLFDAVEHALRMARHHTAQGDTLAKGRAYSRAIDIIDNGLKAGLDPVPGGAQGAQLVDQLSALYDYIVRQLMLANLRDDLARLDEAERLLTNVSSAWREVGARRDPAAAAGASA